MVGLDFKSAVHISLLPRLGVRSDPLAGPLGHVGAVPSAVGINQDPRVCVGEVPTDHQELFICIDCVAHIITQPVLSQGGPPPAVLDLQVLTCSGKNSRVSPSESGSKFYLGGGKAARSGVPGDRLRGRAQDERLLPAAPLVASVTGQALLRRKCGAPSRGRAGARECVSGAPGLSVLEILCFQSWVISKLDGTTF